jgi:hypothetical protein
MRFFFFVFDVFADIELSACVNRIKPMLREKAVWLVSDFVDTKWWHSVLLFIMYRFFGAVAKLANTKLPKWEKVMEQSGFEKRHQKVYYGDFIKGILYQSGSQ